MKIFIIKITVIRVTNIQISNSFMDCLLLQPGTMFNFSIEVFSIYFEKFKKEQKDHVQNLCSDLVHVYKTGISNL